jgi:hypothetical protein
VLAGSAVSIVGLAFLGVRELVDSNGSRTEQVVAAQLTPVNDEESLAPEHELSTPTSSSELLDEAFVSCGGGTTLPRRLFEDPATFDALPIAGEREQAAIAEIERNSSQVATWRVYQDPSAGTVIALTRADIGTWQYAAVRDDGNLDSGGVCAPRVMASEGFHVVPFGVSELGDGKMIDVLLDEVECGGNREDLLDRISDVSVISSSDTLVVTIVARDLPLGVYDCMERPPISYTLTLDDDLGSRQLLDGSSFPPRPT